MIGKIKYKIRKISGFRKGYFMVIGIVCLLLLIGGISYAVFTSQIEGVRASYDNGKDTPPGKDGVNILY